MSTQTSRSTHSFSSLVVAVSLCGCERTVPTVNADAATSTTAATIACADDPGPLALSCRVEASASDPNVLIVRGRDGGFRRLLVTKDGRGVIAADGPDEAKVSIISRDAIEIAAGGRRFRLPAHLGPSDAAGRTPLRVMIAQ